MPPEGHHAVTSNPDFTTNGTHQYLSVHNTTVGIYKREVELEIHEVAVALAGQPSQRPAKPNQPEPQHKP